MKIISSLRRAFTANFLFVAFLPVLIFGLVAITVMHEHLLADSREQIHQKAIDIGEEANEFLYEVTLDLRLVARVIANQGVVEAGAINRYLEQTVQNSQFFESIYVLDKSLHVRHLGLTETLTPRRDDYLDLDFSSHRIFADSESLAGLTWSDTFISVVTGEPSITLGMPIEDGTLLGNLSLDALGRLLNRYASETHQTQLAITDKGGALVAHSKINLAMQRVNFSNHPTIKQALRGEFTTEEHTHGQKVFLESVAPIPLTGWVAWVALDVDLIVEPILHLRGLLIGFMILAIILASVIALMTVRRLMLPIFELEQQTDHIAEGRYGFRALSSGFKEIDHLSEKFEDMSRAIKVREESILTSEKRFRDLVNSIEGVVWEFDCTANRFLFVSRQAESLFGYPVKDWLTNADFWLDRIHPEDRLQAESTCRPLKKTDPKFDCEYRMTTASGETIWVRDLITAVMEEERPVRLLGVMIDITLQKQLDEGLRRSEQNYREIFNATSEAIFIHDIKTGEVIDVNQAMTTMFGYTHEEALKATLDSLSLGESPYSGREAIEKMSEAYQQGEAFFEWRSRRRSGELFWSEVALRRAMVGGEERILAVVRDITERKKAKEKLQEVNERLELLIDRMPIGCIVWDLDFKVTLWNPAAEVIFGYTQEEVIGQDPYGRIVAEDARPLVDEIWQRLSTGDSSAHSENQNMTKGGQTITCEWFNTPLRSHENRTMGVISMVQDVTDRRAAEDELRNYRAHLEDLVTERTQQLEKAQAELVQSERLAVLGQLTATVSHEIRNPLGTVANALYLLRDAVESGEGADPYRPLDLAERNVERCDNIISELLDFSRQREIKPVPLDLDAWLEELLNEITWPADVTIMHTLEAGGVLQADPERLRRALINVITNGLQALNEVDDRTRCLEVETRRTEERCEILIRDNGPGISADVMAEIFKPMFSTKNFGVGLGVPIIKNIMEDHHGGVEYDSRVGEGTTVTLWLPCDGTRDE